MSYKKLCIYCKQDVMLTENLNKRIAFLEKENDKLEDIVANVSEMFDLLETHLEATDAEIGSEVRSILSKAIEGRGQ